MTPCAPGLVVVTDDRFGDGAAVEKAILEPAGYQVEVASCATEAEVARAGRLADGLLVNLAPVGAEALAGLERCRVISRYGIGLDNIDLAAAQARGIAVRNVPGYCDHEVAEHALGLLLALARRLPERDRAIRAGAWGATKPGRRVAGTVLGILGFGGSGRAMATAALGLGFDRILVWSPHTTQERLDGYLGPVPAALGVQVIASSLEAVLGAADWLSLHLALTPETRHLLDAAALGRMKAGASLINTSRGGLVDEEALVAALASGRLGGAGLDVFNREPLPPDSPLRAFPGLVLSDHGAYASVESLRELRLRTASNALEALAAGI